jgi:hypothetical protein
MKLSFETTVGFAMPFIFRNCVSRRMRNLATGTLYASRTPKSVTIQY